MRRIIEFLNYGVLDDVCLALERGEISASEIPQMRATNLGPIIELHHRQSSLISKFRHDNSWLNADQYSDFLHILVSREVWHHPRNGSQGYIAISTLLRDELAWTDFGMRAKRAALSAGFSDDHSGKLVGAIGELYSNVIEHSERTDSGYIVFAARSGRFEFIVADAGIGVLKSLQTNPKYVLLDDAGSALEIALSEYGSRHDDNEARELGFRPLFIGLANISEFIRIRTDDHSREFEWTADGDIDVRTVQKSHLDSFICAVLCSSSQ